MRNSQREPFSNIGFKVTSMMGKRVVRVVTPHFVAGLIMDKGVCVEAAPILRWSVGKSAEDLSQYFRRKGWHASVLPDRPPDQTGGSW
jgi:hypothetical protein